VDRSIALWLAPTCRRQSHSYGRTGPSRRLCLGPRHASVAEDARSPLLRCRVLACRLAETVLHPTILCRYSRPIVRRHGRSRALQGARCRSAGSKASCSGCHGPLVRHQANTPSGGQVSDIEIGAFLKSQARGRMAATASQRAPLRGRAVRQIRNSGRATPSLRHASADSTCSSHPVRRAATNPIDSRRGFHQYPRFARPARTVHADVLESSRKNRSVSRFASGPRGSV
jgi:hypothetical protein